MPQDRGHNPEVHMRKCNCFMLSTALGIGFSGEKSLSRNSLVGVHRVRKQCLWWIVTSPRFSGCCRCIHCVQQVWMYLLMCVQLFSTQMFPAKYSFSAAFFWNVQSWGRVAEGVSMELGRDEIPSRLPSKAAISTRDDWSLYFEDYNSRRI